jgi:TRAP-type mannitol/chloroaromatic compound transport system permease small subunit
MKVFFNVVEAVGDWSGKIFSFIAAVVMVIIGYEVVARYVFNAPTIWATETMTYLCGAYYIMGGAYTLHLRGHVNVDAIYGIFSPRTQAILDVVTFPFFFVFTAALLWTSADFSWSSIGLRETTGTVANLPVYPFKITLPIATFLLILQALCHFIQDLKHAVTGKEES